MKLIQAPDIDCYKELIPKCMSFTCVESFRFISIISSNISENLLCGKGGGVVLAIEEHGIWPSEENKTLFLKLIGLERWPDRRLVIEFDLAEFELCRGMLSLAIAYGWGGGLYAKEGACEFSHDGVISLSGRYDVLSFNSILREWGVIPE